MTIKSLLQVLRANLNGQTTPEVTNLLKQLERQARDDRQTLAMEREKMAEQARELIAAKRENANLLAAINEYRTRAAADTDMIDRLKRQMARMPYHIDARVNLVAEKFVSRMKRETSNIAPFDEKTAVFIKRVFEVAVTQVNEALNDICQVGPLFVKPLYYVVKELGPIQFDPLQEFPRVRFDICDNGDWLFTTVND